MGLKQFANYLESLPAPLGRPILMFTSLCGGAIYRLGAICEWLAKRMSWPEGHLKSAGNLSKFFGERLQIRSRFALGALNHGQNKLHRTEAQRIPSDDLKALSQQYMKESRTRDGIIALRSHLDENGYDAHAFLELFRMHLNLGEPVQAMEVLKQSVQMKNDTLISEGGLADFLYRIFQVGQLIEAYKERYLHDKGSSISDLFTGNMDREEARKGTWQALEKALSQPVTSFNNATHSLVALRQALLYYYERNLDGVAHSFSLIEKANVHLPWMNFLVGQIAEQLGETGEAMTAYSKAISIHPNFAAAQARLGHIHTNQDDPLLAARHFNARLEGASIAVETR